MSDSDGSATPPPIEPSVERKHVPPSWSGPPKYDVSLEVMKDGSVVATLPVSDREHYTIGRQPDACDILLDHPSISRQHAALQYGEEGEPYLIDLGSVHGTFLNKKRLAPKTYTPLMVGGVIKFGQSTRVYHVLGPPELQPPEETSEALEQSRLESAQRQERKRAERVQAKRQRQRDDRGCTWGFVDDDDDGPDAKGDDEDAPDARFRMVKAKTKEFVPQSADDVHEKDRVLFERIQKWRLKIVNLENEMARIRAKDDGAEGLSEGQQRQIDRNEERITALEGNIKDVEDTIRDRNLARSGVGGAHAIGRADDLSDASDDDDFYDRTEMTARKRARRRKRREEAQGGGKTETQPAIETVESLEAKLASVEAQLAEHRRSAAEQLKAAAAGTAASVGVGAGVGAGASDSAAGDTAAGGVADDDDDLEAFMRTNVTAAREDLAKALSGQEAQLLEEQAKLQHMLALARPALPGLKPKQAAAHEEAGDKEAAALASAAAKANKKKGRAWVAGGASVGTGASAAAPVALTEDQKEAELDAAFGGKSAMAPTVGLGAGGAAPATAAALAAAKARPAVPAVKKKKKFTLKPGLNIRKKK